MSKHALMISAALVALLANDPAMAKGKGTLYTLPLVSGSTETVAFGINNNNVITGFWLNSSGIEEGFVGPDDGSNYTTFDTPEEPGTQPRGINLGGIIMGIENVETGAATDYIPFERSAKGTITEVTMKGTVLNYLAQGITTKGIFTGNYENSSLVDVGYTGKNAKYTKAITLKGIKNTGDAGRGIDDAGDIVGWYLDSSAVEHGFYLPAGGKPITVDNPGGTTTLEGINNKGTISGLYTDASSNRHGFTYDIKTKKFSEITISGATYVEAWGLNDLGNVAVDQVGSSGTIGYIYCPVAKNCPKEAAVTRPRLPVLHRSGPNMP